MIINKENNKQEDQQIINNLLAGNKSEFEKLEKKYKSIITLLIRKMIKNEEDVQDLVQETFIKAYTSIDKYNHNYPFSAWIYKIASNHCIDFLRRKRLQTIPLNYTSYDDSEEFIREIEDNNNHPEIDYIKNEQKNLLEFAISKLPEKYKTIFRLRHEDDLDYKEISLHLNIPIGTVKVNLFRARKLLYDELKKLNFFHQK